jgi:nicotinamide-nucleotide amidase
MANILATIITIGDELLIGQTIDTNSAWIAKQLNLQGIDVQKRIAVGDTTEAITNALDEEIPRADIVLLTGGLGPTADDITKPLLCTYFNGKMIVNNEVLAHVKDIFTKRNRPFLERNIKQAEVPDVCKVLFNPMGTAPGMLFEKDGKLIIAMPGVPFEMMAIMETAVLPFFKQQFKSDAIVHRTTMTIGEGESFIAERIIDIEEQLPKHIKLAYLPSLSGVKLRLTGKGNNEQQLIAEVETWQRRINDRLQHIIIATDDVSLEQVLGNELRQRGQTISLAESCTGGYISHLITLVKGSSDYFKGSIVSYLVEVKENILGVSHDTIAKDGAVSEQVALQMANGVRRQLKTDYSLSITGILDKQKVEGESAEPGTIWVAVSGEGFLKAKQFKVHHDRERNKESAATLSMLLLLKAIKGQF